MHIGEEGTEQFTITTRLDGKIVGEQKIHDPFHHTKVVMVLDRWSSFRNIFRPKQMVVTVALNGTEGAIRAIMMLDPAKLGEETAEILVQRRLHREYPDDRAFCVEAKAAG